MGPEIGVGIPMLAPLGTEMMDLSLLKRLFETVGAGGPWLWP